MLKSNRSVASLAIAAALSGLALPAQAESVSQRVGYADLNLSSSEGQKRLERRIANAIVAVCGSYALAGRDLVVASKIGECREKAEADARAQMEVAIARAEQRGDQRLAASR